MGHETTEITERYYSKFARKDVKRIVKGNKGLGNSSVEFDEETLKEFREFQAFKQWWENQE